MKTWLKVSGKTKKAKKQIILSVLKILNKLSRNKNKNQKNSIMFKATNKSKKNSKEYNSTISDHNGGKLTNVYKLHFVRCCSCWGRYVLPFFYVKSVPLYQYNNNCNQVMYTCILQMIYLNSVFYLFYL